MLRPLLFVFISWFSAKQSQPGQFINFPNPSFEGQPGEGKTPGGWKSNTPGSTPDIFPGAWGLKFEAQHGSTCLGLVVRDDGTSENITAQLPEKLKAGVCYTFSIQLRHAEKYVGFNNPARLRVWGGASKTGKEMLLASTQLVDNQEWKQFKLQFVPTKDVEFITLEAYFAPGALFHYKGNVLLDNCSSIERCDRA